MDIVMHMITKCNQTQRQLDSATHTLNHSQAETQSIKRTLKLKMNYLKGQNVKR